MAADAQPTSTVAPAAAMPAADEVRPAISAATTRQTTSGWRLTAYAGLAIPLTMTALPINILLPQFYSSQTGLALTTIGLVLLATRLVDAVADPLLGLWIDQQKQGVNQTPHLLKRRYLRPILFAAPLLALGFALLFTPVTQLGPIATTAWLFSTLVAAYVGYSLMTIAYQGWGAELAHHDAERTRVTGLREAAGLIGVLLGAILPTVTGMPLLVAVFLSSLSLALWLLARQAPAPLSTNLTTPSSKENPFTAFVVPLGHQSMRWLLLVFALNALAPSVTATVFQFFVADRLQLAPHVGTFLALYFIAGVISMPLWIQLAKRFALPLVWLIGMLAAIAAFVGAYGLTSGNFWGFALICVLSGAAFGADLAVPSALLARVIEANGHQGSREGMYFGLWNFVNKLVLALAGGLALPLLGSWFGYTPGTRDAAALSSLAFVYAVVPCLLKLVAAGLLLVAWRSRKF